MKKLYMELYLHSPYILMESCSVKHWDNLNVTSQLHVQLPNGLFHSGSILCSMCLSHLICSCYMPCQSYHSRFHYPAIFGELSQHILQVLSVATGSPAL